MNLSRVGRGTLLLAGLAALSPVTTLAADGSREVPGPAWEEPEERPRFAPWAQPNLQLQTWFTAYDQDRDPQADPGGYGDPEHDVGFSIPRARLGLRGGWRVVEYHVRFGTSRPYDAVSPPQTQSIQLIDGWTRLHFRTKGGDTWVSIGQHQIPFSREMQMSSNDLVFQERAVNTNWTAPNRDIGASVRHNYKWFTLAAGVYNGGGDLFGDEDPGVRFATRFDFHLGGDVFRTNSKHHAFGLGAAYLYNRTFAQTDHRVAVDLIGRYHGVTLQAEGQMVMLQPDDAPTILPPGVPENTRRLGGFVQLSYYREIPLGAIEPAVRFAYYDHATHLQDNGDVGVLHGGVNWREPVPFMDFGAGYIHRMELQGSTAPNDSARVWVGFKYPSRRYKPLDLVELFRGLGVKSLDRDEDAPPRRKPKAPVGDRL